MYADSFAARQSTVSSPRHPVDSSQNPPNQDARLSDPGQAAHSFPSAQNLRSSHHDSNFKEDVRPMLSSRPHSAIPIQDHIGSTETPLNFYEAPKPYPQTGLHPQTVIAGQYMAPIPDLHNMWSLYASLEFASRSALLMSSPQGYWQWQPLPVSMPTIRTESPPGERGESSSGRSISGAQAETSSVQSTSGAHGETSSDQSTSGAEVKTSGVRSTVGAKKKIRYSESGTKSKRKMDVTQNAFFKAVQNNPRSLPKLAKEGRGLNLDAVDPKTGETALTSIAGRKGDKYAVFDQLLACGANPEVVNRAGRTPLMCASVVGNAGIVRRLLEVGSEVLQYDRNGWNALSLAATGGHHDVVEHCLQRGRQKLKPWEYESESKNERREEEALAFFRHGVTKTSLPSVSELNEKGPATTLGKPEKKIAVIAHYPRWAFERHQS
jgi:hypothetical protein